MDKKLSCNGPNCCNASLIARGFLRGDQIRYSNEWELGFYLRTYCQEVPICERKTHDIVAIFKAANGSFSHCGYYIDSDVLFTKGSPAKSSFYSLENWTNKFKDIPESMAVYRCPFPLLPKTSSELATIEAGYSKIVDSDLEQAPLMDILIDLEQALEKLDESSLSVADTHALKSLKSSLTMSKVKQVMLMAENDLRTIVSVKCIKAMKKTSSEAPKNMINSDNLQPGDLVTVDYSNELIFRPGEFYSVVEIL